MDQQFIGILLARKEWNKFFKNKSLNEDALQNYVGISGKLQVNIALFPIHKLILEECKTEAVLIEGTSVTHTEKTDIPAIVYNPAKYNRKRNIKKLRALSQHEDVQVINEHHIIKEKYFLELLSSVEELRPFIKKEETIEDSPYLFYLLGQMNANRQWEFPIIYAKDEYDNKYSFQEAYMDIYGDESDFDEIEELLYLLFQKVFHLIQFYYPGIFELGIRFELTPRGNLFINTTYPVNKIKNDLHCWSQDAYEAVLEWPIKVANDLGQNNYYEDNEGYLKFKTPPDIRLTNGFLNSAEEKKLIWAKLIPFHHAEMIVQVPSEIWNNLHTNVIPLQFGVKEINCQCVVNHETIPINRCSYEHPLEIFISTALIKKMHIPINNTYQLLYKNDRFILGPSIGFLLGEKNQLYNPDYMEKFSDRFGEYDKYGGLVLAFSPRSVDWDERIAYGMLFDPEQKRWRYASAPIPSTLYRRNFHQDEKGIKRLQLLTNNKLFNSHYFKKSDLCFLQNEPSIKRHLPPTYLLNDIDELIYFTQRNYKTILKPVSLSRGRGIFILENTLDRKGFILHDYRKRFRIRHVIKSRSGLMEMMRTLNIFKKDYLFQTYIPLLQVNGRPFDVRVVMQKYDFNKWKCSGIECRVAKENEDLTNIARGGSAMTLEEILLRHQSLSNAKVLKKILNLCHKFCELMERKEYHFAELGLDIALDQDGYPWILEANIFPSFKGFKEMDYETYLQIRYQPLLYAVKIQGFNIEEEILNEVYGQTKSYL